MMPTEPSYQKGGLFLHMGSLEFRDIILDADVNNVLKSFQDSSSGLSHNDVILYHALL